MGGMRGMATLNQSKKMRWRSSQGDKAAPRLGQPLDSPSESDKTTTKISDPFDISQQAELSLFGTRLTGEPRMASATTGLRYMAPVYLPSHLQRGIMPALLSDPWPTIGESELRKKHAEMIIKFLRLKREAGGGAMTTQAILNEINSREGRTFSSEPYVKALLEHLRVSRMVKASLNPSVSAARAAQSTGVSDLDPLIYYTVPHQQEEYGSPAAIALRNRVKHRMEMEMAYRRLRRGKTPYPIHRRMAYGSALSHELGREQVEKVTAQKS